MTVARITTSSRELLRGARESCGIDIDDFSIVEALERLLHALNTEAQLNEHGAKMIEHRLRRLLCNRLRMQRDIALHPEISQQILGPVLVVSGNPRSGSTKLQKLLAATGDFKYLLFWQVHNPSLFTGKRDEDCGPRIAEANEYIQWMNTYAPGAQANHGYRTFEPEEEALFLEHFIAFIFPFVLAEIPSYLAWWASQDFTSQACFLKLGLQYLQWQFHDGDTRPWLLKAPMYSGFEEVLAKVFAGTSFVITHRNPHSTVPSTANLVNGYREGFSDRDYRNSLGPFYLASLREGTRLHMAVRRRRPDLLFHDVAYSSLTSESERVIESIYAFLGMTLSETARIGIRNWEATYGADGQKTSRATLQDFGLTTQMITREFVEYVAEFERFF